MNERDIFNELKEGILAWDEYNNRKNNLKITRSIMTFASAAPKIGVVTSHSSQEYSLLLAPEPEPEPEPGQSSREDGFVKTESPRV